MVKKLIGTLGLEPERVRLEWVSAAEGVKFADTVRNFVATVKELGPNPLKQDVLARKKNPYGVKEASGCKA